MKKKRKEMKRNENEIKRSEKKRWEKKWKEKKIVRISEMRWGVDFSRLVVVDSMRKYVDAMKNVVDVVNEMK